MIRNFKNINCRKNSYYGILVSKIANFADIKQNDSVFMQNKTNKIKQTKKTCILKFLVVRNNEIYRFSTKW